MITEAADVPRDSVLRPDVLVIGAGAAGITLALELAGSTRRVVVLEAGGTKGEDDVMDLHVGPSVGDRYAVEQSALFYLGGATNHWGGWCRPMNDFAFPVRPWVPHSGWPVTLAELDPYYRRANRYVQLPDEPFEWSFEYWNQRLAGEPDTAPLLDNAEVTNSVTRFSPFTRFGKEYRPQLEAASNVEVVLHASALELETDPGTGRVTGVPVATLAGNRFRVEPGAVVVATGGIQAPRLLLVSRSAGPQGIGNANDLVGRYFMDHLEGTMATLDVSHLSAPYRAGYFAFMRYVLQLTPAAMAREELLGLGVYFDEYPTLVPPGADRGVPVTPRQVGRFAADIDGNPLREVYSLDVHAEPTPNPDSRVTLADEADELGRPHAQLDYQLLPDDFASIRRTLDLMAIELARAGLGRMRIDIEGLESATEPPRPGWHLMGTTRMGSSPADGVVDTQLGVFGTENLFVCSSSVFPCVGYANPTYTIVALAIRLADRLKQRVP